MGGTRVYRETQTNRIERKDNNAYLLSHFPILCFRPLVQKDD